MIQCTCAGLASHCGKAKKLIDSLWLGDTSLMPMRQVGVVACLTFKMDELFGFRPGWIIGAYTLSTRPYSTLVVCEDDMFLIY